MGPCIAPVMTLVAVNLSPPCTPDLEVRSDFSPPYKWAYYPPDNGAI
jgi:hypothetical protein